MIPSQKTFNDIHLHIYDHYAELDCVNLLFKEVKKTPFTTVSPDCYGFICNFFLEYSGSISEEVKFLVSNQILQFYIFDGTYYLFYTKDNKPYTNPANVIKWKQKTKVNLRNDKLLTDFLFHVFQILYFKSETIYQQAINKFSGIFPKELWDKVLSTPMAKLYETTLGKFIEKEKYVACFVYKPYFKSYYNNFIKQYLFNDRDELGKFIHQHTDFIYFFNIYRPHTNWDIKNIFYIRSKGIDYCYYFNKDSFTTNFIKLFEIKSLSRRKSAKEIGEFLRDFLNCYYVEDYFKIKVYSVKYRDIVPESVWEQFLEVEDET